MMLIQLKQQSESTGAFTQLAKVNTSSKTAAISIAWLPSQARVIGGYHNGGQEYHVITKSRTIHNQVTVNIYSRDGRNFNLTKQLTIGQVFSDIGNETTAIYLVSQFKDKILIVASDTINPLPTYTLYNLNDKKKWSRVMAQHNAVPSAMTSLTGQSVILFYSKFYATATFQDILDLSTNKTLSNLRREFRTNSQWCACSQELCLGLEFDSMTRLSPSSIAFKDKYVWTFANWPPSSREPILIEKQYPGVSGPIEASFQNGASLYLLKGSEVYIITNGKVSNESMAAILGSDNLDVRAAVSISNDLIIFTGCCWYQRFTQSSQHRFTTDGVTYPLSNFYGLPRDIDSAMLDNENNILVFKDNFYFVIPSQAIVTNQNVTTHPISVFKLFTCANTNFYESLKDTLGISTQQEWLKYASRIRIPAALEEDDLPVTTPRPMASTKVVPASGRWGTPSPLHIVALFVIFLMGVFVVTLFYVKQTQKHKLQASSDITFGTVNSTVSANKSFNVSTTYSQTRSGVNGG
ncbi:hypothetical protein HDE_13180 [Halotydeus destructor]|nr:hypothetical protein HDE_13180 [Halotydeus destructor]